MLKLLFPILLSLFMISFAYADDGMLSDEVVLEICKKEEEELAKRNPNYKDTSAYIQFESTNIVDNYRFGKKVQDYIRHKNLKGFLSVAPSNTIPKRDLKNRTFDDFFSEEWRNKVINAQIKCFAPSWRGYKLSPYILYQRSSIWAVYGAKHFSRDTSHLTTGWIFQGKIIYPHCFVNQPINGEGANDAYRKAFPDIRLYDTSTGGYDFENKKIMEPIPSPWGFENEYYLVADIQDCFDGKLSNGMKYSEPKDTKFISSSRYYDEEIYRGEKAIFAEQDCGHYCYDAQSYAVLAKIPLDTCQSLAPSFPGKCVDAAAIYHIQHSSGSIGDSHFFYVMGIFEYKDKFMLVPLQERLGVNGGSSNVNDGLRHLDSLKQD